MPFVSSQKAMASKKAAGSVQRNCITQDLPPSVVLQMREASRISDPPLTVQRGRQGDALGFSEGPALRRDRLDETIDESPRSPHGTTR
jgi:hypothetical protein